MTKDEFAARLKHACASVMAAEAELTEIDSKFGDADHGLTMAKIAGAISAAVDAPALVKKIGKTTYKVRVHFSNTSTETMSDKIKRMLKNEIQQM